MKRNTLILLTVISLMSLTIRGNSQTVSKCIKVSTPGTLTTLLTTQEKTSITELHVAGNIDARDFKCMRDEITNLNRLDLYGVSIQMYIGPDGTSSSSFNMMNTIPENAFLGKYQLSYIILPNNLMSVESNAFQNCFLMELHIKTATPPTISSSAFSYPDMCQLYCPLGSASSYSSQWSGFSSYTEENTPSPYVSMDISSGYLNYYLSGSYNIGSIETLELTGTIDATDFATISSKMTSLRNLNLGATTISGTGSTNGGPINDGKFYSYAANHIPQYGLKGLYLQKLVLPESITQFDDDAFKDSYITSMNIPGNLEVIGRRALSTAYTQKKLRLPKSLKEIKAYAFYNSNIDSIFVDTPSALTSIGDSAFYFTGTLQYFQFPNNLEKIGEWAFDACNFVNLTFPSGLKSIGNTAFFSNGLLEKVDLSNTKVDTLKFFTFYFCPKLKDIRLPETSTIIPFRCFEQDESLKFIDIPESVTSIESYAFRLSGLTSIKLPDSLKVLGSNMGGNIFNGLSLKNLTIPAKVKTIYPELGNCGNLEFVMVKSKTPVSISSSTFTVNKSTCRLYVPKGSLAAYQAATGWKDFSTIIEIDSVVNKTIDVTAGNIASQFSLQEKHTVTDLTVTGNIDVRDILFMRDSLPSLAVLNLKDVTIAEYTGDIDQTYFRAATTYEANALPLTAFKNNLTLKVVTLPKTLSKINAKAFWGCSRLQKINLQNVIPITLSVSDSIFTYVKTTKCILGIPENSESAYRSATGWNSFYTMEEATQIITNVANDINSKPSIKIDGDEITISGTKPGEYITVFNIQGSMLLSKKIKNTVESFNLPISGSYIVRVGNASLKLLKR